MYSMHLAGLGDPTSLFRCTSSGCASHNSPETDKRILAFKDLLAKYGGSAGFSQDHDHIVGSGTVKNTNKALDWLAKSNPVAASLVALAKSWTGTPATLTFDIAGGGSVAALLTDGLATHPAPPPPTPSGGGGGGSKTLPSGDGNFAPPDTRAWYEKYGYYIAGGILAVAGAAVVKSTLDAKKGRRPALAGRYR